MCCIDWFWSVAKRQLKRFDQVCLCYRVQIHRKCCCQSWYYTENWEKKGRKWTLSWSLEVYDLTLHILFKWARLSWGLCVYWHWSKMTISPNIRSFFTFYRMYCDEHDGHEHWTWTPCVLLPVMCVRVSIYRTKMARPLIKFIPKICYSYWKQYQCHK